MFCYRYNEKEEEHLEYFKRNRIDVRITSALARRSPEIVLDVSETSMSQYETNGVSQTSLCAKGLMRDYEY